MSQTEYDGALISELGVKPYLTVTESTKVLILRSLFAHH